MATAGSIASSIRVQYGDVSRDWLTDDIALDFIDKAQKRFVNKVLPLDEYQDFCIVAKVQRYDVASDMIWPVGLTWYQSKTEKLTYVTPEQWEKIEENYPNATGNPDIYTFIKRQLLVGPQVPSTRSATALASGAGFASATAIALTAASGTFRSKGFLKNVTTGEVIEYNTISGATVSGITRGVHNTTAASVASTNQFQQVDLICRYRRAPAAITATTASPEIPAPYHEYIEKYALYLAYMARGDNPKADRAFAEFEDYERDTVKKIGRRAQDGMIKIQEARRRVW